VPPTVFLNSTSLKNRLSNLRRFFNGCLYSSFEGAWPPLGILYIATVVRNAGYDVSILDVSKEALTCDEIIGWVKKENPDIVGITSVIGTFPNALEIIKKINEEIPSTRIIVGGPHITFVSEQTLREYPFIDVIVRYEGEETILEVLEVFQKRKKIKNVNGISYIHNQKIVHNPRRKKKINIDDVPFPDRKLLKNNYTNQLAGINFVSGSKFTTIISSRGCSFNCTFCSCAAFSNRVCAFRTIDNFLDELEQLVEEGYSDIGIVDDNFMINPKRVEKICKSIKDRHLDFHWWCEGRVDSANYALFKKMKSVGCEIIYFGIESATEKILKYYRKGTSLQQSIKTVNSAKRAGMNVVGSFIVGAPIETKSDVIVTLNYIRKLGIDIPQINILGLNPGTALWEDMALKTPEINNHWKSSVNPVNLGMCEYSYEWLSSEISNTLKRFVLDPSFLLRQTIKCLTDPYRLKILRNMFNSS